MEKRIITVALATMLLIAAAGAQPPNENVSLVCAHERSWHFFDVEMAGDYLWAATWGGVSVFDIQDPQYMHEVDHVPTPGMCAEIVIEGDRLYALDTSTNFFPDIAGDIRIFDISDPEQLVLIGEIDAPGRVGSYTVDGDDVFAHLWMSDDLLIYDTAVPAEPVLLSSSDTPSIGSMDVAGDRLYAGVGDGIMVFDISDPANPVESGGYTTDNLSYGQLLADGDRLYGILQQQAPTNRWLQSFDRSDPDNPQLLDEYQLDSYTPVRFAVNDGVAWLATGYQGVLSVAIAPDGSLTHLNTFEGSAIGVAADGQTAIFSLMPGQGESPYLAYVGIANPQNPQVWGSLQTRRLVRATALQGDRAAVALSPTGWSVMLNADDPVNLSETGPFSTRDIADLDWHGDELLLAGADGGLVRYDLSEPGRINFSDSLATATGLRSFAVQGDIGYMTTMDPSVLGLVDLSDPDQMTLLSTYDPGAYYAYDVVPAGEYAWIAGGGEGFLVVDVSDPLAPSLHGALQQGVGAPQMVARTGNLAVLATVYDIHIVDVQDPATPVLLSSVNFTNPIHGLSALNSSFAVTTVEEFFVYDLTDPENPEPSGYFNTPGYPRAVELQDNGFAWVADTYYLTVLDCSGALAVGEENAENAGLPDQFRLLPAYPNPFNGSTTVQVALPMAGELRVGVYDITGRRVATLASGVYPAGLHRLGLDASRLASGNYLLHARHEDGASQARQITLLK